ncbi:hypothetical protein G6F54_013965 [Rhizopus delemar]|nr:hypothetical protein G6F54_013965 [Rhizopus delemar]
MPICGRSAVEAQAGLGHRGGIDRSGAAAGGRPGCAAGPVSGADVLGIQHPAGQAAGHHAERPERQQRRRDPGLLRRHPLGPGKRVPRSDPGGPGGDPAVRVWRD